MDNRKARLTALVSGVVVLVSCTGQHVTGRDLMTDPYPERQAELRQVVESIARDAMTANVAGLQAVHLRSEKFTKFGPRGFDRQDVDAANDEEAQHFTSISNLRYEIKDLKIDVFGDVGVVTYYPYVSFVQDGEEKSGSGRQTLVLVKTAGAWKIVHEHGTPRF